MHRLPLLLSSPSFLWKRDLPECILFENTLNQDNFEETSAFMKVLDVQAECYKIRSYRIMEDLFKIVQRYLSDSKYELVDEGTFIIDRIILQAPKDSSILSSALFIRGNLSYHACCFEQASKDYEMYLEVYKFLKTSKEEICEVYGKLAICMYMMRKLLKVKTYSRLYKKNKDKLQPNMLQRPELVNIENFIKKFANEIHGFEYTVSKFLEDQCKSVPYKGFNSRSEISAVSSMCFNQKNGIYVKDDIAKASVLFVEDPILQSINVPFLECELCYYQSGQKMYTCLECRYKTYCSLSCLEKDKAAHKDECVGYEQLTLIMLDASSIFRVFVRISIQLYEKIFNPVIFRKLSRAEEVFEKLFELLNNTETNSIGDLVIIKKKPSYFCLSNMQYSTLVATAFRLAIFIKLKTDIINKYYKNLHISNEQKLILIGAILMRIQCNYIQNCFDFEVTRTIKTNNINDAAAQHLSLKDIEKIMQNINRRHRVVTSVEKFYNVDENRDVCQQALQLVNARKNFNETTASQLPILRHVKSCKRIHRILSTYKDNIAELYFPPGITHGVTYAEAASQPTSSESAKQLCGRIANMTVEERFLFVKKFAYNFHSNYVEYFHQMIRQESHIKQVLTLYCPTLRKFNHSCQPNVEVIILDNGTIIGKALRNIRKGEQLFVAYKANYLDHCKLERQMLLKDIDVNCECKYCKMDEHAEPLNLRLSIYCYSCKGVEITPNDVVCSFCYIRYDNLLSYYGHVIHILENEIHVGLITKKLTERDVYILHLILCSYCKKFFTPQNEIRIFMELKMAHFLAVHNFAKQSYNIIRGIMDSILKFYDEQLVWFTFYAKILQVIKIILFNNLDNKLITLSSSDLLDLCTIGLNIARGQKQYLEFYEVFDADFSNVLDDIKVLLKWRTESICFELPSWK